MCPKALPFAPNQASGGTIEKCLVSHSVEMGTLLCNKVDIQHKTGPRRRSSGDAHQYSLAIRAHQWFRGCIPPLLRQVTEPDQRVKSALRFLTVIIAALSNTLKVTRLFISTLCDTREMLIGGYDFVHGSSIYLRREGDRATLLDNQPESTPQRHKGPEVARVVHQPSLDKALNFLVLQSPPSGNIDQNANTMRALSAEFVLQDLIPTTLLRSDALASYTPINDEDARDQKLSHIEVMNLGLGSEIVSRIFIALFARLAPNLEELESIIDKADHVDSATTHSLARAFLAFQEGEFEVAATLAIPRIETLARARLAKMGNLQYRVQRGSKRGVYPQLGTLIRDLRPSLDSS